MPMDPAGGTVTSSDPRYRFVLCACHMAIWVYMATPIYTPGSPLLLVGWGGGHQSQSGASIPMGLAGSTCPPNILEMILFRMSARVTATVVCCILMQILCVVSQKKLQLLGDFVPQTPYRGGAPGLHVCPQTPSLLLCPLNNPMRSTPLIWSQCPTPSAPRFLRLWRFDPCDPHCGSLVPLPR